MLTWKIKIIGKVWRMVSYAFTCFNLILGHFIIDNFLGDTKSILFGVFDGHGGREIVDFLI